MQPELEAAILRNYEAYGIVWKARSLKGGNIVALKKIFDAFRNQTDAQPSNILLNSDCTVKLCDFGLTRSLASGEVAGLRKSIDFSSDHNFDSGVAGLTEYVATRWYRAPEILLASNRYTKFVDMWSLGCIVGEMHLGKPLFQGTSTINQIERIVSVIAKPSLQDIQELNSDYGSSVVEKAMQKPSSSFEKLFPHDMDRTAMDLVKNLIQLNPSKRLTVNGALQHPYVEKFRDPANELSLSHSVVPPLNDNHQLSVSDYRSKLYELILEKKQQRRRRRMLCSVELMPHNSRDPRSQVSHSNGRSSSGSRADETRTRLSPTHNPLAARSYSSIDSNKAVREVHADREELPLRRKQKVNWPDGKSRLVNVAKPGQIRNHHRRGGGCDEARYQLGNSSWSRQSELLNSGNEVARADKQKSPTSPQSQRYHHGQQNNNRSNSRGATFGVQATSQPLPSFANGSGQTGYRSLAGTACLVAKSYSRSMENPVILRGSMPVSRSVQKSPIGCNSINQSLRKSSNSFGYTGRGKGTPTCISDYSHNYGTISNSQLTRINARNWIQ